MITLSALLKVDQPQCASTRFLGRCSLHASYAKFSAFKMLGRSACFMLRKVRTLCEREQIAPLPQIKPVSTAPPFTVSTYSWSGYTVYWGAYEQ